MEKGLVQEINRKHVSRRRWRKFWSLMAATAAFCTTYVLILPAITMSRQLVCGYEEHSHVEQCYEPVLICGQEAEEGHTHTDECYTQETVWICGLAETEGHIHTDECFEAAVICGQEESEAHTHTEECFSRQLICGKEAVEPHTHGEACAGEEKTLVCTLPEVHTHTDSCYAPQEVLTCTLEEHTHTEFCYDAGPADANADVETRENWEKAFSKLEFTENRAENVMAVAMTQLGCRESERNYVVVDQLTLNGYTRYGAWYGDPYGDWDAMFASFVLHYAEVDDFGKEQDPARWAEKIAKKTPDRFQAAGAYQPGVGDLVFFDRDLDDEIDGVGILTEATESTWRVMVGDAEDAVSLESYARGDNRIKAFAVLGEDEAKEESTQPPEDQPGAEGPTEETGSADPTEGTAETGSADPTEGTAETAETAGKTEYTVTYIANNGTEETRKGSGETTLSWQGFTVPEGKLFMGWNTAPDGSGTVYADGETLTLTGDLTLYAQWIPGYTVTYLANNGTEETGTQKGSGEITLSWQGFTVPEGKLLSSWNTAPDGTGTDYDDGETLELTQNLTLYAQWIQEDLVSLLSTPLNVTRAAGSITLKKQIEKLNTSDADDYSYRLHLTLNGSSLSAGSTTTVTPTEKRKVGILLDVTETMNSSWSGSTKGQTKFDEVWDLLEGNDGLVSALLDGNTEVSIIWVGSASSYNQSYGQIAKGDELTDFHFVDSSQHQAQLISYVTGLRAAEEFLGNDLDSLIYIVGNEPTAHVDYGDGSYDRTLSATDAAKKDFEDYKKFMAKHSDLSMYMVGVAGQQNDLEHEPSSGPNTAEKMGQYSVARGTGGGYFEATNDNALKDHLDQIAQTITVKPDKVTGITVSDPLSGNVTLADAPNYSATLNLLKSDGSVKETKVITDKVEFENGSITCNYPDAIEGPFNLEITFDIKTKDGVYQPYTDKSNTGTVWGNDESPAQDGFFSNGNATAEYTLNGTPSKGTFPKPVVQAPQKATINLEKKWVNAAEADKKAVTVELHRGSAAGEKVGTVELSADNRWTASCDVKVLTAEGADNLIVPVEQTVDGFTTTYDPGPVSVTENGSYTITVTNTKKEVKKSATLTVTKQWQNVPGTQNAVIHVCTKEGTEYKDIADGKFEVTNGTGVSKDFSITWTTETPPEVYVYEESSKNFYPLLSGSGTAQIVAIGDKQYSAMELTTLADKGTYTVSITNMASVQMPETGGTGTQPYVLSGLVLMFSAVLLMQIPKIKPKGGQEAPPSGE